MFHWRDHSFIVGFLLLQGPTAFLTSKNTSNLSRSSEAEPESPHSRRLRHY